MMAISYKKNKIPTDVIINKKVYFLVDELCDYDSEYFKESYDNLENIVIIKNIPKSSIIYTYVSDLKTFVFQEIYLTLKLYIESEWTYNNIPKMIQLRNNFMSIYKKNKNINLLYEIISAPKILILNENELFQDFENNIINIEILGDKKYNKCYFNYIDIITALNLPNILNNIKNNIDYVIFNYINKNEICENRIYFTYSGILHILNIYKSEIISHFTLWFKKLFNNTTNISEEITIEGLSEEILFLNKKLINLENQLQIKNIHK